MSDQREPESVIGRKRTADGILIEVRAIGVELDELTLYVQGLLVAADAINTRMRAARHAYELALFRSRAPRDAEPASPAPISEGCEHIRSTMQRSGDRIICSDCGGVFRVVP